MKRIFNVEKVKKDSPIIQHNSRHNLINQAKKNNKVNKKNKEAKKTSKIIEDKTKEEAKKAKKEAKEKAKEEAKKNKKDAKDKEKKEVKEKAKEAKEAKDKDKKEVKDLKDDINSFHKKKNYKKVFEDNKYSEFAKKCLGFLKRIKDSKLDKDSKSKLEKKIQIRHYYVLSKKINILYKKQNYIKVLKNIEFDEFQKKCILYLRNNIFINKNINLETKIQKMYNYAIDDLNYGNIVFDYEDEPIQDIIYHLYDKFKIEDYSIKNINKVQKNLMNKFKFPIFRKFIRDDFKVLKKRINLDKNITSFKKKSIEYKKNNMKELKKNIKNNDLIDNNEGGVGINELLMQNPLINLEDDTITKKKVIKKDKYIQQKLI